MTGGGVAPEGAATAPTEREWRWFVLALVGMVVVTAAPAWPPALALPAAVVRLLFPVEQFALLVLVAIAACALVGWWAGGRLLTAMVWIAAAGYMVWKVPLPATGYGAFLRGWVVMVGAAFGVVCLATRYRPLLGRAMPAVALAFVVMIGGLIARTDSWDEAFQAPARIFSTEYQQRLSASLDRWRARSASPAWQGFVRRVPVAGERVQGLETVLTAMVEPTPASSLVGGATGGPLVQLAPALLALESLLALALGWAAYHRLSRGRIGPPLGGLRTVRFNDQWVWGLIVGATIVLLPSLAEWRLAGLNLLAFFGTLYALRGAGVLICWIPDRMAGWLLPIVVLLVPVLGPVWVLLAVLGVTFVLGLGDTWRDFRAGALPRRPPSP